ncbi:hypothetical protein [Streptomyces sp. BBFR109]|uniref:hypothetical protein n=1 Tax=Streptomyces sp. BBFR109 TaxID=3448172 RepID=UPI003F760ADD
MQAVSSSFIDAVEAPIRRITYGLRISFDKTYNDATTFFTLDSSLLDGPDVLSPSESNPIQQWYFYKYLDFTDRVVSMEWTRELDFPDSVISAMADVAVDNYDDYFTPGSSSPISSYILPKRPMRLLSGINGTNLPQFVGITEKIPVVDDKAKTAAFHAIDFLSEMFKMPMNKTIAMQDARTDEVLAAIFTQFGLDEDQYNLPVCRNVIPFVFYEKGQLAGDVIRRLMQAEMGSLWLDEAGIIQLDPRVSATLDPVWTFDESNVVEIKTNGDDHIINTVKIYAELRKVQEFQTISSKASTDTTLFVVAAGQSREYEAELQDPALSAVTPTFGAGSGPSWFTAALPDGTPITTGLSVTAHELRTNTYVFTIQNSNAFDVNIDQFGLWGQPAKVVDKIEYTEVDQDSIDKYGEQVLEIDNTFIQSTDQCDSLAFMILDQFAEYANEVEMTVKGNPALQLGDIVTLDVRSYAGTYKITKILDRLADGGYTQTITARHTDVRRWFVLDQSLLDGPDVLTV